MSAKIFIDNKDLKVAFWRIEEPLSYFEQRCTFVQRENLDRFQHPQARLQWLASRLLLFELLGPEDYALLDKDRKGKPKAEGGDFCLSISHSEQLVAVALCSEPVGLDIQQTTPKLARIAHKFIPANLLAELEKSEDYESYLHLHWGIKEALFKVYGKGQLDFRKHLFLQEDLQWKLDGDLINTYICKNEEQLPFKALYQTIYEDYLLCVVTKSNFFHL